MSYDIDAIREQSDRYTGATGASQSYRARQLAAVVPGLLAEVDRKEGLRQELAAEVDRLTELLAFRDREIVGHRREFARLREQLATSAEAWDTEFARLRAENERLTDEVERLRESYVVSQSAVLYHMTSADLLREHLAAARQGRVWPASATPAPLPRRIPGQSADEVGELPALVQPAPIDVMQTLRTEGEKP
jgi:chromosome segregation ATPase